MVAGWLFGSSTAAQQRREWRGCCCGLHLPLEADAVCCSQFMGRFAVLTEVITINVLWPAQLQTSLIASTVQIKQCFSYSLRREDRVIRADQLLPVQKGGSRPRPCEAAGPKTCCILCCCCCFKVNFKVQSNCNSTSIAH